jgi:tetratricopeptide (TPR) repeat protein
MNPLLPGLALAIFLWTPARAQEAAPGSDTFQRAQAELAAGQAWKARGLFEQALHEGYPRADGYLALADAYLALDNRLFQAREAIERALKAEPEDLTTWYRLVELNLRLDGMDAENRARRALLEILRRDPDYRDAYERWRGLYMDRKDARRLAEILGAHLEEHYRPELALRRIDVLHDAGAHGETLHELERFDRQAGAGGSHGPVWSYYMGVTLAALGRDVEGWRHYRRGIESATSGADLDPYFTDLEPLLQDVDRAAWTAWSLQERRDFLEGWWNLRDPLPFGDVNERWVEQQRRIRFARETFQYKKPWRAERLTSLNAPDLGHPSLAIRFDGRAMDDRTEIFLRHGEPDMKGGVGADECGFWYYRREGLPEGESFAMNFRQARLGNDCVYSRTPTTAMGHGHFAPGGIQPWDVPRIIEKTEADLAVARSSDSYPFEIAERIPVDLAPASFSHLSGRTDLVVYFSVPVEAIVADTGGVRYRKGLVVYDREWREIARQAEEMQYASGALGIADDRGTPFLIDLFRLQITPGEYNLAIQIDDRNDEGVGVWKGPVTARAFHHDELEISDVVLAGSVQSDGLERFTRYGHTVRPLPSRTLLRGQSFFLYYEIYDLPVAPDGRSRFRVEYAIRSERLDRGAIRRLFGGLAGLVGVREEPDAIVLAFEREETNPGRALPEALSFDTRELAPGTYRVEVTVTDQTTGESRARQEVEFAIAD